MDKFLIGLSVFLGFVVMGIALALLLAFPTMWAWNYTMPYLFGLKAISFWQAFALNYLTATLIKSSQTNNNK